MIQKLDKFDSTEASIYHVEKLYAKVSQLVDAVNELQVAKDVMFNRIDRLNDAICDMRNATKNTNIPKMENVQDKFAEQRRWIGKLCWFSNGDGFDEVGYLTEINPDMPEAKFRCNCHDYYEECKPVKPDSELIYHGE